MRKNKALRMEDLTKNAPFEDVLPLITPMIKRLAFEASSVYGLEREDLEQEFSLKAFLSWQSWEPGHGSKFSTYVFDVLSIRSIWFAPQRLSAATAAPVPSPSTG